MLLSDFIKDLQRLKAKHGDKPIYLGNRRAEKLFIKEALDKASYYIPYQTLDQTNYLSDISDFLYGGDGYY